MAIAITILLFLLILGVLIFVHEAGHYFTARRNGIGCHEFGFGFPPRIGGVYKDRETGKWKLVLGNKQYFGTSTLYSINWIPLGGFVRIKGEDEGSTDPDDFATKSHWVRFKVLVAGVVMNFITAWVLFAIVFMLGTPKLFDDSIDAAQIIGEPRVQVGHVFEESAAKALGLRGGDVITQICVETVCTEIRDVTDLQFASQDSVGKNVNISVLRGEERLVLEGRIDPSFDTERGALGVQIAQTAIVKFSFFSAVWEGLLHTIGMTIGTLLAFGTLIKGIFVETETLVGDIMGPIGIVGQTGHMQALGLSYLLSFSALLSVNLAIINILPIPALDGGRIMFLIIDKIKGRPVNPKTEAIIHNVSFMLLIILMLAVTAKDIIKLL